MNKGPLQQYLVVMLDKVKMPIYDDIKSLMGVLKLALSPAYRYLLGSEDICVFLAYLQFLIIGQTTI